MPSLPAAMPSLLAEADYAGHSGVELERGLISGECQQVPPAFELPNFETPDGQSPTIHIQALRNEIQQEWSAFRRRVDEAAADHFKSQEALFIRCLENVSGCQWFEVRQEQVIKQKSEGKGNTVSTNIPGSDVGDLIQKLHNAVSKFEERNSSYGGASNAGESDHSQRTIVRRRSRRPSKTAIGVASAGRGNASADDNGSEKASSCGDGAHLSLAELQSMQVNQAMNQAISLTPGVSPDHTPAKPFQNNIRKMVSSISLNDSNSHSSHSPSRFHSPLKSSYKDMAKHSRQMSIQQSGMLKRQFYARCSGFMDWWLDLQEPERTGRFADFVNGKKFEMLCAGVIIFNAGLSASSINREVELLDPNPSPFMAVMENIFVAFYTIELVLKIIVHKGYYFCNEDMRWNIFDAVLVAFSLFDLLITHIVMAAESDGGGGNFTFMRTLRILKMARVLRGLRVMRFFHELRLMLNSLIGSLLSLFWSIMMMSLIFYIFGLVFVQGVSNYLMFDEGLETGVDIGQIEKHANVMKYFGRVERAVLSLYQASTGGDDWWVFFDAIRHMDFMYRMLFIFFIAFSQIALLNILTAIFVQRAMKLAEPDRESKAMEVRNNEMEQYEELRKIVWAADESGNQNGSLSLEEFCRQIKKGRLGASLAVLGLDIRDPPRFFKLVRARLRDQEEMRNPNARALSKTNGEIQIDPFVEECMRMRGNASSIDIMTISHEVKSIQNQCAAMQLDTMLYLQSITKRLEEQEIVIDMPEEQAWPPPVAADLVNYGYLNSEPTSPSPNSPTLPTSPGYDDAKS